MRDNFIDHIRIIACLMVIAIHTDQITLSSTNYVGGISWWLVTFIVSLSRVAVPLFIIVSGALIFHSNKTPSLEKTTKRLLLPFLVWFLLYYKIRMDNRSLLDLTITSNTYHLYFLPLLAGLYLATPYLRIKANSNKWFLYLILFSSLTVLNYMFFHLPIPIFLLFIPFIGYYLSAKLLPRIGFKTSFISFFLLGIIQSLLFYFSTINNVTFFYNGTHGYLWHDALSPLVILQVIVTWNLIKHISAILPTFPLLAKLTFGVYLIHPFVIDILNGHGFAIHQIHYNL